MQVLQAQINLLPDDAGVARDRRADEIRRQLQDRVGVELGSQPLFGQLDAVTDDAREADFQGIAVGPHSLHVDGLARRLRRRHDRLGREIERDAQHVGVFGIEQPLFVELIRLAP